MATNNNIEYSNLYGSYSFVENTKNDISWHRLGQRFDHPLTAEEAINACNANFNVSKQPIAVMNTEIMDYIENGLAVPAEVLKQMFIDGKVATVRDDTDKAPIFPAVWKQIEPLIEGLPLVAHNKPYDTL